LNEGKLKMSLSTVLILILIGVIAGGFSGFVGLGGGVIIVPALVFILGMSQHMAQGTTLAMMIPPIGILAVMNYYKKGLVDINSGLILATSFVLGGYFGSRLALSVSPELIKKVFGVIIIAIALKMMFSK
jgi:uncharacterized membrane protein YfcA